MMSFPTFEFLTFFTVVLILNWFLKRWPLVWRIFLLSVSYFFYSLWDFRFLIILLVASFFNFYFSRIIGKNYRARKLIFILSIIANISLLGVFKYYDFFRISTESLLEKFGFFVNFPLLEIILPVGLSFYIFRIISYNIDVYFQRIAATPSFLDFGLYVAFFPQILSGPIVRAGDFLPQLEGGGSKNIENFHEHLTLIILGLFKKLVLSSYLILLIADDVFAVPENHSSLIIFLAILSYSLIIYFDFSSYSDMAIGFAGLLGFKTPLNFDRPYLSVNIQDFWRRWHITFSSWIRDYIYIPLGGNRKGLIRKYLNLLIAMVLAGLWHGAAFHFIIWGFIQGAGLVVFNIYHNTKKFFISINLKTSLFGKIRHYSGIFCAWLITFLFISFSWIFFRSNTTNDAVKLIKLLFNPEKINEPLGIYIIGLLTIGFLTFIFEKQIIRRFANFQKRLPLFFLCLFVIFVIILILKLGPDTVPQFIYFNF